MVLQGIFLSNLKSYPSFLFWILSPKRLPISYSNTLEAGFEPAYLVVTLTPELFRIAPEVGFEPTTHNVFRQSYHHPDQYIPCYHTNTLGLFGNPQPGSV